MLIWVLVISLWGVMVYQYLGEEEKDVAKMKRIVPYGATPRAPSAPSPDEGALAAVRPTENTVYAPAAYPPPAANLPAVVPPSALAVSPPAAPPSSDAGLNVIPPSSEYVGPAPSTGKRAVSSNPAVTAVGVVFDPSKKELWQAVRGGGAVLNGTSLRCSTVTTLAQSLVGTGFGFSFASFFHPTLAIFCKKTNRNPILL